MTQIVTGYKRSLKIVVNKTIGGVIAAGYPMYYPTALDVLNGYFTLNGINYSIPSQEELGLMEQSEYDVLLLRFKQYVSLHEPDLSFSSDFVNSPEVYAPDECYEITTTTTEAVTTTTTYLITTTTTEELVTTTTTEAATTTTTTVTGGCEDGVGDWMQMFDFDVNTENATEFPWFELDFQALTGCMKIDFGDGLSVIENEVDSVMNAWTGFNYKEDPTEWWEIPYPDPAGDYNVKVYFKKKFEYQTLQTALDATYLLYFYDLETKGVLDISMFPRISNFDIQHALISSILLPTTFHPDWGLDAFMLHTVSDLQALNMTECLLPSTDYSTNRGDVNNLTVGFCFDLESISFPKGDDYMYWVDIYDNDVLTIINIDKNLDVGVNFKIYNCPLLSSINITGGNGNTSAKFFGVYNCPSMGYFDVTRWPNLTSISGSASYNTNKYRFMDNMWDAATVNHVLTDLDSISVGGYIHRTISIGGTNAAPDATSGGYDGLAAKASLEAKGFTVETI